MSTYSDHNGYFIMVDSVAIRNLKLCRRMCLMCAEVAQASTWNQLCATRVDGDVVTLPCQSDKKFFTHRPTNSKRLDSIAQQDIVTARTTKRKFVTAVASRDNCVVDRTYTLKETSGLEKRQIDSSKISHLLSNTDISRSKTVRFSQACLHW